MTPDARLLRVPPFVLRVHEFYVALMQGAGRTPDAESVNRAGLRGRFLWAGELGEPGRALVVAGNLGGAATLGATTDLTAQKQAIREGVIDFLVNNLDEALRIVKNEIRKQERVAVCIAADPQSVMEEMTERGVQADWTRGDVAAVVGAVDSQGGEAELCGEGSGRMKRVAWSVDSAPAHWLPKVDALAMESLPASAGLGRRWLQLAPRYLGRLAGGVHTVWADEEFAMPFMAKVRRIVESGEIATAVTVEVAGADESELHRFDPPGAE